MQHRVVSKALDTVAADVDSTIVVLDYSLNKTVPVPEGCRRAIEDLESKPACAAGIDPDGTLPGE
jgi:hypothetical protein